MNPTLVLATFLAGLAFFFFGLDLVKMGLKALANRRFRKIAAKMVNSGPLAAVWGVVFGAVTQSASAVAFLLVGLVSAGLLPLSQALVTVTWANLGTTILVFIVAFDVRLVALFLVAVTGLALAFGKSGRWEPMFRAGLGIGMLILGLRFMNDAVQPLTHEPWFEGVAAIFNKSLWAGFAAGALLRILIQSSSGIIIVLITLAGHGALTLEQTLMFIHGTGLGVGLTIFLPGSHLEGNARQISLFQAIINTISSVLLAAWLLAAESGIVPSLLTLLDYFSPAGPSSILAAGFGVQMMLCVFIGMLLLPHAPVWLAKLAPPNANLELSRTYYLDDNALETPDIALELVEKEQGRVLNLLPGLLAGVRADGPADAGGFSPVVLRQALQTLNLEIAAYLEDLMTRQSGQDVRQRILMATERQRGMDQLAETLASLAEVAGPLRGDEGNAALATSMIEGVDTILSVAVEAACDPDQMNSELLATMTSDRSDLLEGARHSVVHRTESINNSASQQEAALLYAFSLFERTIWLVRQLRL